MVDNSCNIRILWILRCYRYLMALGTSYDWFFKWFLLVSVCASFNHPFQSLCKDKNWISAVTMPICGSRLHEVITTNSPAVIERLHLVNTSTADGKTHTCFVCFASHLGPPPGPTILAHVLPLFPFSSFTLTSKGGLGRRSTSLLSGEMVCMKKCSNFGNTNWSRSLKQGALRTNQILGFCKIKDGSS